MIFDQHEFDIRCEWGLICDVIIIIASALACGLILQRATWHLPGDYRCQ